MLDLMRKHAKSWVINLIIAAIAIVFVFWGVGSYRGGEQNWAARINGETVSMTEFTETYNLLLENYRRQLGDYFNEDMIKAFNLKGQALEKVINERILFQQARQMGIEADAEELQKRIASQPAFQVDGKFNKRQYVFVLARYGYTPTSWEEIEKRRMIAETVQRLISSTAKVTPAEVENHLHLTKDKINLEFVQFNPENFKDQVKPTEEEIKAFFEKDKEPYRLPAKAKVVYVAFRAEDYVDQVQVSEEEIVEDYNENKESFFQPAQVKARHILLKLNPEASEEEVAAVMAKAEEILLQAMDPAGPSFERLAQIHSEGPTAPKGGDLGWFDRAKMVKPFSDAAFSLEKGQISRPVRSQFGVHLIKVEDQKPEHQQTLDEARDEIRRKIAEAKAADLALEKAEEAFERISLSQEFDATVDELGLTTRTTDFFSADEVMADDGLDAQFNQVALDLQVGEISPLLQLDSGRYIMKCLERKESRLPELKEVEAEVTDALEVSQASDLARKAASEFLAEIKKGDAWEEAAEKAGMEIKETGPFVRSGSVPLIGGGRPMNEAAFALNKPGDLAEEPIKGEGGWFIIRLKEKLPIGEEEMEAEKDKVRESLLTSKGQRHFQAWLETVRDKAEIQVAESLL